MSTVKVHWNASEKMRVGERVAGSELYRDRTRTWEFDLNALTVPERKAVVSLIGIGNTIDMTETRTFDAGSHNFSRSTTLEFDGVPLIEQVAEFCQSQAVQRSKIDAARENERQEKEAAKAAKRAEEKRIVALIREHKPAFNSWLESATLEELGKTRCTDLGIPGDVYVSSLQGSSFSNRVSKRYKELQKEAVEAEKAAWITAHGSSRLARAHAAGYDCQRLYVTERACSTVNCFTVDFDDNAEWKSRCCPSEEALDIAEEAKKLNIGVVSIVWVTRWPFNPNDNYDYYEPDDPGEAVVIEKFLGKYTLLRAI